MEGRFGNRGRMRLSGAGVRCLAVRATTRLAGLVAAVFLLWTAPPAGADPPRIRPDAMAAALARQAEPFGLQQMIDAALWLSGTDPAATQELRARMGRLVSDFLTAASGEDPAAAAEMGLVFMHERVLSRYVEEQTRVDVLLETGEYNCVSSAVLYMILMRAAGMPVIGVRTRDHAFCAVRVGDRLVDVETTTVYGYDPGARRDFQDSFGRVTGYSYVPPNRDPSRVETGDLGLLALIAQNRASLLTRDRRYADAVGQAADAYELARDEDARAKLVIGISNAVSALAEDRRYPRAIAVLDEAVALHGDQAGLARLRRDVLHNWIVSSGEKGDLDAVLAATQACFRSGGLDERDWRELMVSIYQMQAQAIARDGGYLDALRRVREGISLLGRDARLLQSERVYLHNSEVEAHNAMAAAFNRGDLQEARLVLRRALALLPESARLRGDLQTVEDAISR